MAELDDIADLHADERVWRHRPEGRHANVAHTRGKVVEMEEQWRRDGLGYWVARLRRPVAQLPAGAFVGVGGCAVESHKDSWNLYYRFRPESHGHGLATELALLSRPRIASLRTGPSSQAFWSTTQRRRQRPSAQVCVCNGAGARPVTPVPSGSSWQIGPSTSINWPH